MACKRFTYSGDPSNGTLDEVRFLTGDTVRARAMFGDSEVLYQLSKTPNPKLAGAELLEVKARQFARLADERVGDVSKSLSKLSKQMKECAADLRRDATRLVRPFFGGLTISGKQNLASDPDAVQPSYSVGMTDYPGVVQLNRDLDYLQRICPGVF